MLFAGLCSTDELNDLFWIRKAPKFGQHIEVAQSSPIHLYCMTDPVSILPRQVYRQYLKPSQDTINQKSPTDTSKVPFHTDSPADVTCLTPHLRNCAMVGRQAKFTFEYRTDPDASVDGFIRGILIGVPAYDPESFYGTPRPLGTRSTPHTTKLSFTDTNLQTPDYAIQHHLNRGIPHTVVWKALHPHTDAVSTFDATTGILSTTSFPNFFKDGNYDFSGGLVCPGDAESLTYTIVKTFLKGAESLPEIAAPASYDVQVTLANPGTGYSVGDEFTVLDGGIVCAITAVDEGMVAAFTTTVQDPTLNPLGSIASAHNVTTVSETGTDATVNIQVTTAPHDDHSDWHDVAITDSYTDSGFKIILAWRTDITGSASETITKEITIPVAHPDGLRTTPVLVWHDGDQPRIEIFYTRDRDVTTGMFRLFKVSVDPYSLGLDSSTVTPSSEQYVGLLPYVIGHKSPRVDGQRYVQGFYDMATDEYFLPIAQTASGNTLVDIGLPGMLQGISVKPKSGVENTPAITPDTIRSFEIFASDYNATDSDVLHGRCRDFGTYQFVNLREGPGQMSLFGSQPNKSVQYINLDYVWSGATLSTPIEKDEDDLLRVIYSYDLGNR